MLQLEPIAEHHLDDVQRYASDPAIGAMSTVPSPYPADGAILWHSQVRDLVAKGQSMVFAMTEDEAFRGVISIGQIDRNKGRAHLDYWVALPYQRRGLASRAVALAMAKAVDTLQLNAMLSSCLVVNIASARVLERNGFCEHRRTLMTQGKFKGQELRHFFRRLTKATAHTPI